MRQLERSWRPWRRANQGSTRARWRRLANDFSLDLPLAGSAVAGLPERLDPWDAGGRAALSFPWRPTVVDDEPKPA